jgi:hypothetical protein
MENRVTLLIQSRTTYLKMKNKAFTPQHFSNTKLQFGSWHINQCSLNPVCIPDSCQHVRNRISHHG